MELKPNGDFWGSYTNITQQDRNERLICYNKINMLSKTNKLRTKGSGVRICLGAPNKSKGLDATVLTFFVQKHQKGLNIDALGTAWILTPRASVFGAISHQ
jgi:hypothetical protein